VQPFNARLHVGVTRNKEILVCEERERAREGPLQAESKSRNSFEIVTHTVVE
jgi:hypothetical protein